MHELEEYKKLFLELGLTELSVKDGEFELSLKAKDETTKTSDVSRTAKNTEQQNDTKDSSNLYEVKSPLLGVFYAGEAPKAEPYVHPGDHVKKGDILCTIEAMKMLNDVTTQVDGVVKEIYVNEGDLVEYQQPLYVIELQGGSPA